MPKQEATKNEEAPTGEQASDSNVVSIAESASPVSEPVVEQGREPEPELEPELRPDSISEPQPFNPNISSLGLGIEGDGAPECAPANCLGEHRDGNQG